MKKMIVAWCLLATILVNDTGCATVRIRTDAAQGAINESAAPHATVHRWFWGYVLNSEYLVADCQTKSLQSVRVRTRFWEGLVTVVTLGIYCPVEISWVCAKEVPPRPVHPANNP